MFFGEMLKHCLSMREPHARSVRVALMKWPISLGGNFYSQICYTQFLTKLEYIRCFLAEEPRHILVNKCLAEHYVFVIGTICESILMNYYRKLAIFLTFHLLSHIHFKCLTQSVVYCLFTAIYEVTDSFQSCCWATLSQLFFILFLLFFIFFEWCFQATGICNFRCESPLASMASRRVFIIFLTSWNFYNPLTFQRTILWLSKTVTIWHFFHRTRSCMFRKYIKLPTCSHSILYHSKILSTTIHYLKRE